MSRRGHTHGETYAGRDIHTDRYTHEKTYTVALDLNLVLVASIPPRYASAWAVISSSNTIPRTNQALFLFLLPLFILKGGSIGGAGLWPLAPPSQNKRRNAKRERMHSQNTKVLFF